MRGKRAKQLRKLALEVSKKYETPKMKAWQKSVLFKNIYRQFKRLYSRHQLKIIK